MTIQRKGHLVVAALMKTALGQNGNGIDYTISHDYYKEAFGLQSLRSRIIIWLIRNRHLFKLKIKPDVVDENFSVTKFREDVEKATRRIKMPEDVTVKKEQIGQINAEWISPETPAQGKVLLYIHGGGFISGSCNTHRMHVAKFAKGSGITAVVFDYRLAPEYPFPTGLEDCVTVYHSILKMGYRPQDIIIGGESAGATLTLSLLLTLKKRRISLPKAAFVISPVTDLRCQADSFRYNAKNDIAPMGSWDVWTKYYIGDNDPANPLLSPQMGDYKGLPPLHICVGTHEIHLDDCENLARKAKNEGVDVILSRWRHMVHAFPILSPLFPEAKHAMSGICEFVKFHTNPE